MIISEIQREIGHCSCASAKIRAPADFSHHAILFFDIVLKLVGNSVFMFVFEANAFSFTHGSFKILGLWITIGDGVSSM